MSSILTGCGIEQVGRRIINGHPAKEGRYPWMVHVNGCGGSVINDRFILTAAHCIHGDRNPAKYHVVLGAYRMADIRRLPKLQVKRVIPHPQNLEGNPNKLNDIALLELAQPLRFNDKLMPICLPDFVQYPEGLKLIGFGAVNVPDRPPEVLQEVEQKEIPFQQCKRYFPQIKDELSICAGDRRHACRGDSGGPLMTTRYGITYQVGIVSFGGEDCGKASGDPGIFERTTAHIKWIKEVTQGATYCSAPGQAIGGSGAGK